MKKYVVTGGAGFIGSALVRALLAREDGTVEVIDNLLTGKKSNLAEVASRVVLHEIDIRDYTAIAGVIAGADTVFHLAAIPSVPRSITDPVPSHEVNIDGTFNVLRVNQLAGLAQMFKCAINHDAIEPRPKRAALTNASATTSSAAGLLPTMR